jgi:hypothetical protein
MAKKRKTREQKRLADKRHDFHHSLTTQRVELPLKPIISTTPKKEIEYPYLAKDLTRTVILSSLIIGFQFFLFLILKNHFINIPGISY